MHYEIRWVFLSFCGISQARYQISTGVGLIDLFQKSMAVPAFHCIDISRVNDTGEPEAGIFALLRLRHHYLFLFIHMFQFYIFLPIPPGLVLPNPSGQISGEEKGVEPCFPQSRLLPRGRERYSLRLANRWRAIERGMSR